MIKLFCDRCKKEIKDINYAESGLRMKYENVMIKIIVGTHGKLNTGEICKDCVMDAVKNGKELIPEISEIKE